MPVSPLERRNLRKGLLFISPWLLGFLAFSFYPLISAFLYSFTDYSVLASPVYVGGDNYQTLIKDEVFWKSVFNTLGFAAISVPFNLIIACLLALLLNFNVIGKGIWRTIFFLPSLVPMVCLGIVWRWLLNGEVGLVNQAIQPLFTAANALFGSAFATPSWLEDPAFTKPGLIIASAWCCGHSMIIFLAGMQETPVQLYEAAEIDGAGFWGKLWHVTLPMISPYMFFNLVMGLIGSFQIFAVPYVLMDGANEPMDGPERSMLFVATYIFQNAFNNWDMGYACAISLIFILVVAALTLSVMKIAERKVYYAGGGNG